MKNNILFQLNEANLRKLFRFYELKLDCIEFLQNSMFSIAIPSELTTQLNKIKLEEMFAFAECTNDFCKNSLNFPELNFINCCETEELIKINHQFKLTEIISRKEYFFQVLVQEVSFKELIYTAQKNIAGRDASFSVSTMTILLVFSAKYFEEMLNTILKYLSWNEIQAVQTATLNSSNKIKKYYFETDKVCFIEIPGLPQELIKFLEYKFIDLFILKVCADDKNAKIFIPLLEEPLLISNIKFQTQKSKIYCVAGGCKPLISLKFTDFRPLKEYLTLNTLEIINAKQSNKMNLNFEVNVSYDFEAKQSIDECSYIAVSRIQLQKYWIILSKQRETTDLRFIPLKVQGYSDLIFIFRSTLLYAVSEELKKNFETDAVFFKHFMPGLLTPQSMKFVPEPDKTSLIENIEKLLTCESHLLKNAEYLVFPKFDIFTHLNKLKFEELPLNFKIDTQLIQGLILHKLEKSWVDSSQLQIYLNPSIFQSLSTEFETRFHKFK